MTWKDEILKNKEDMRKYNEGANMMYDIINKYLQLGVLDYDKHLMEFTKCRYYLFYGVINMTWKEEIQKREILRPSKVRNKDGLNQLEQIQEAIDIFKFKVIKVIDYLKL